MADLRQNNRREAAHRDLYQTLDTATLQRDSRCRPVHTANGPEPGWVVFERQTMLDAVNRIRAEHNLPPVDLAAIERIDNSAAGHIDWMEKFVRRCAALAVGEDDRA
jgi:uncharacterized protein YkwD